MDRRARFSDDDLYRLEEWVKRRVRALGLRRSAPGTEFQLEGIAANTWQAGLDRILLGVTMAEERQRLFGTALPLDDVDSGDIDLAGRLAEFLQRLQTGPRHAHRIAPGGGRWASHMADLSDSLVGDDPGDAFATRPTDDAARGIGR